MRRRHVAILALVSSLAPLTGCAIAEKAQENAESIGAASSANCVNERETFQLAMESYLLLNGKDIAVEADMVPDYLRTLSPLWDIDAAGNIVPQPGGGCE